MLLAEQCLTILQDAQSELITCLSGMIGKLYQCPDEHITQIVINVLRSREHYQQHGLDVFGDFEHRAYIEKKSMDLTYLMRMDLGQRNCQHYLYIHAGAEYRDGNWLVNTIAVQCRKIPDDFTDDDQLNEDIADAQHLVRQIHRCIGAEEGSFLEYEPGRKIDHCLDVLRATVVNIWTILKWRTPSLERSLFIRSVLASVLHFERYRMVRFREEDGNLMIDFYYKKELFITQMVHLPIAFDELL